MKTNLFGLCAFVVVFGSASLFSTNDAFSQSPTPEISEDLFDDDLDDLFDGPASLRISVEKPTMELSYSSGSASRKSMNNKALAGFGYIEGRIGSTKNLAKRRKLSSDFIHERTNYVYFGGGATSLGMSSSDSGAATSLWRFGIGDRIARGWNFGDAGLILFYGSAVNWSQFSLDDTAVVAVTPEIKDFHGSFCFGKFVEGGAGVRIGENVAITAGYEQTAVFHRHLVFYWITSEIIEGIAHGAVEAFVRKVEKSSPGAAPAVGFLLHNAVGFGAGLLRKEKMNWPFNTEPALLYSGIRLGASFRF